MFSTADTKFRKLLQDKIPSNFLPASSSILNRANKCNLKPFPNPSSKPASKINPSVNIPFPSVFYFWTIWSVLSESHVQHPFHLDLHHPGRENSNTMPLTGKFKLGNKCIYTLNNAKLCLPNLCMQSCVTKVKFQLCNILTWSIYFFLLRFKHLLKQFFLHILLHILPSKDIAQSYKTGGRNITHCQVTAQ